MAATKFQESYPYNVLYIEDSVGVGGSIVSLNHLLKYLDKKKFFPYAVVYHKNQENYLNSRCHNVKTIVARPRSSLKSSCLGRSLVNYSKLTGKVGGRVGHFFIFLVDFFVAILPYALRLYFYAKDRDIHLVHLNTGVCIPGVVLAKLLRVPCIATQRGPEWISPVIRFFSKSILLFIAISETTKNDLIKLGVDPLKIAVMNPAVDFKKFDFRIDSSRKRKEFALSQNEVCFGIIGVLAEWKGHRVFLEAAAKVLSVVPDCKVFVIGDTPDGTTEYKNELIALTEKLAIRQKVIFTGFRPDVPELIQLLDIVVHTSITPEPFGKVIIEGMAMKKPVIATCLGGPAEIIEQGRTGFLVPPEDPELLSQKIIELLSNEDLVKEIGEAAWRSVKSKYDIRQHVEKMESIYHNVLSI
jgi:glycosyltransferase involved in cell wall biosynthesis